MMDPNKSPFDFLAPLLAQSGMQPHPNFLATAYRQSLMGGFSPSIHNHPLLASFAAATAAVQAPIGATGISGSQKTGGFLISDILQASHSDTPDERHSSDLNRLVSSGQNSPSASDDGGRKRGDEDDDDSSTDDALDGGKKSRKARTIFTDKQLQALEDSFDKQKYLSVQDRMELAQRMGLSDTQVKTWYQNRRTKWKRQTAVGMELLTEAGNFAAVQQLLRSNPYWTTYLAASSGGPPSSTAGGMFPGAFQPALRTAAASAVVPPRWPAPTGAENPLLFPPHAAAAFAAAHLSPPISSAPPPPPASDNSGSLKCS